MCSRHPRIRSLDAARVALPLGLLLLLAGVPASAADTVRVSVDGAGVEAAGFSSSPAIDPSGRFAAFLSTAPNLVVGDGNDDYDVFVHDLRTGAVERVSVGEGGLEADGSSLYPSLSKGARFVAFESTASNLVSGDISGERDIFVRDRRNGTTERVNVEGAGVEATGGPSFFASISANGNSVAFSSAATNLVAGDGNGRMDVFVRDRKKGETTRVSVNSAGIAGNGDSVTGPTPAVGGGERYVAFLSAATNLVAGDVNGVADVFVHDRRLRKTMRVSVDSAGVQGNGSSFDATLSANGRFVAFASEASNLVAGDTNGTSDVFVHDAKTGVTARVSVDSAGGQTDGASGTPSLSKDGRYVAFHSLATNLVAGDTNGLSDVFVHDRKTGTTVRASVAAGGAQSDGSGFLAAISGNGRSVVFESSATNLVPFDGNDQTDVFVRTLQ